MFGVSYFLFQQFASNFNKIQVRSAVILVNKCGCLAQPGCGWLSESILVH